MNNGLYSVTIKDIPQDERPIERLIACGPEALSTAEIMAIVIRCGTRGENVVELGLEVAEFLWEHEEPCLCRLCGACQR